MKRQFDALAAETFDLLVIGGGITGAGVALDAMLRGLRVALVERGDFASGTSSVSSKLVHGGLRYLETGDFGLVYEALHERGRLLRNAAHLVHPLRFVLPFYRGARVPPWKWRVGLGLYDLLAGWSNIRRSRSRPVAKLRKRFPDLRSDGLLGGGEYHDAQMDDARLCLAVLRSAAQRGAVVVNYAEVVGFESAEGQLRTAVVRDRHGDAEVKVAARQFLNATGPWGDALRRLAGEHDGPLLRPTKGVHLVAAGPAPSAAFLLLHPRDGRVFFVIPWMSKRLIGTTDTDCEDAPEALSITEADENYLLEGYNAYFAPPLEPAQVLGRFVGVRPLLRSRPGEPSSVSREYRLDWSSNGLLTVAGGKYTTYRHMAEKITDAIARRLGCRTGCHTRSYRLDGAPAEPWPSFTQSATAELGRQGLDAALAGHLLRRYGTHAFTVASYVQRDSVSSELLLAGEPDRRGELDYQRAEEMALLPEDHLFRRTRLGLFGLGRL